LEVYRENRKFAINLTAIKLIRIKLRNSMIGNNEIGLIALNDIDQKAVVAEIKCNSDRYVPSLLQENMIPSKKNSENTRK
jgi:hypothetical protein